MIIILKSLCSAFPCETAEFFFFLPLGLVLKNKLKFYFGYYFLFFPPPFGIEKTLFGFGFCYSIDAHSLLPLSWPRTTMMRGASFASSFPTSFTTSFNNNFPSTWRRRRRREALCGAFLEREENLFSSSSSSLRRTQTSRSLRESQKRHRSVTGAARTLSGRRPDPFFARAIHSVRTRRHGENMLEFDANLLLAIGDRYAVRDLRLRISIGRYRITEKFLVWDGGYDVFFTVRVGFRWIRRRSRR